MHRTKWIGMAAAAFVVLTLSPTAASGEHAPDSVRNTTAGAPVTLTVSISGEGFVSSSPAGISCGSVCSAQFPDGTGVTLDALPAAGSTFNAWPPVPPYAYDCYPEGIHDQNVCFISLDASVGTSASVLASFISTGPMCNAPGVEGKTLAKAKELIIRAQCGVGKVRYASSLKVQKGRVISQNPRAGWQREQGATVNLIVGKGRR